MRRLISYALLICLTAFPALAHGISGQHYDTFYQYYKDDIDFINANDNRHLLPLVLAKRDSGENDGKLYYDLVGDVLSVSVRTDPSGEIVEVCSIVVTAPDGMEYGNAQYNDFAISGYHSFALLMAMVADAEPAKRYELVNAVVGGMEDDGEYTAQIGVYALHCTRVDRTATLMFEHSSLEDEPETEASEPDETVPPEDGGDEGAGQG